MMVLPGVPARNSGEQRGDAIASHELAALVDKHHAVAISIEGDAEVGVLAAHRALADRACCRG